MRCGGPRFLSLQGDARLSTLQGVGAAVDGASVQIYARSLLRSFDRNATDTVGDGIGGTVAIAYGYPQSVDGNNDTIYNLINVDTNVFLSQNGPGGNTFVSIGYDFNQNGNVQDDNCYLIYGEPTALGGTPTIDLVDGDGTDNISNC